MKLTNKIQNKNLHDCNLDFLMSMSKEKEPSTKKKSANSKKNHKKIYRMMKYTYLVIVLLIGFQNCKPKPTSSNKSLDMKLEVDVLKKVFFNSVLDDSGHIYPEIFRITPNDVVHRSIVAKYGQNFITEENLKKTNDLFKDSLWTQYSIFNDSFFFENIDRYKKEYFDMLNPKPEKWFYYISPIYFNDDNTKAIIHFSKSGSYSSAGILVFTKEGDWKISDSIIF